MFRRKTKGKKSRLKDWLIVIALFLVAGIIIRNGLNSNTQNNKHLAKTETSVVTLAPTKEPTKEKQDNNVSEKKDIEESPIYTISGTEEITEDLIVQTENTNTPGPVSEETPVVESEESTLIIETVGDLIHVETPSPEQDVHEYNTYYEASERKGRGAIDAFDTEPNYINTLGYAVVYTEAKLEDNPEFSSTPWYVPVFQKTENGWEQSENIEHKKQIGIIGQELRKRNGKEYQGYLEFQDVETGETGYIDVKNYVTAPYWDMDIISAVNKGYCIAAFKQKSKYEPVDKFGAKITIRDNDQVLLLARGTYYISIMDRINFQILGIVIEKKSDSYTCDWDCYTETTRITYELDGVRHQDEHVYAEVFPDNNQYRVYYLVVGDNVLIDDRDTATDPNVLLFLRKRAYTEAVKFLSEENYEAAYPLFDKLGDFENSAELKDRCIDEVDQLRYEKAQSLMDSKKYEDAIAIFESLGNFLDSSQRADQCREAIKEIAYQNAVALLEAGNYEQAIIEFTSISDYKDSQLKIAESQAGITENEYNHAVEIMAEGKYAEAIAIFETLNGYSESVANILACQENINSQNYANAEALYSSGKYAEAKDAFTQLGDYNDSKDRVILLQGIISSIDREITLPELEIIILQGQKIVLEPTVSSLNQATADETTIVYTSSDQNVARVAKDGTVTAAKDGVATIRCEAADNPYVMVEVTVHVVKNVNRIVLSSNKADLSIPEQNGNSSAQLSFTIDPEDAYIKTGVWSSSNENVATVDQEGNIKAIGLGHAVITFTSDDSSKGKKAATCNINVIQAVTSLELAETSGTIYVGKPVQLKPTIQPQNAANKKLTWSSSNEEVATVNANGQVKGIMPGEVEITATSSDGPSVKYNATIKIPPVTLKVSGTAKCIAKNHVGSSWSKEFYLNGDEYRGTGKVTVENGDVITVGCWISENDSNPDTDGFTETIEITPEIMTKGLRIEETVYVTENGGRYSGYSAEWSVVITIKP